MSKLYVGNLPDEVKEKDIRELFSSFGDLEEVAVLRGYCFVHFVKSDDAMTALKALDETDFMGSTLSVQVARTKGHGYGHGSGPPRPRGARGYDSYGGGGGGSRRSGRDGYRDGGGYRDSYREQRRQRNYEGQGREYDHYPESRYESGDYYDRYGGKYHDKYSRYKHSDGGGYGDRYERDYDGRSRGGGGGGYEHYYDDYGGSGRYSDYRGRSRSPPRDYYSGERERFRDDGYRVRYSHREGGSRRW